MKRDKPWIVEEEGIRPMVCDPNLCMYCRQPKGLLHKEDCVIRKRTVVINATFQYVIEVPEDWDSSMIEFHRGESSLCVGYSVLQELNALQERRGENNCLCSIVTCDYEREATKEDEEYNKLYINEAKG